MGTTASITHPFTAAREAGRDPYKVADVALADFGRKEIRLAEHEMPGLMALRAQYAEERPLAGAKIMGSLHMTVQRRSRSRRAFRSSPGRGRPWRSIGGAPSRRSCGRMDPDRT